MPIRKKIRLRFPVHEEITYGDIHTSKDNLWNFMFFTGYLKMSRRRIEGETIYLEMTIHVPASTKPAGWAPAGFVMF